MRSGLLLSLCVILLSASRPARAEAASPSPTDSYLRWIDAAAKNDVPAVAELTSKTRKPDLDLKTLCGSISASFKKTGWKNSPVHEEISGDSAVVVYRVEYGDGKVKYWMDKLVREDGSWKVVPHLSRNVLLRDAK